MGGRDAARGLEYQYLSTLEYSLDALLSDSLTKVVVDAPPYDDPGADQEIVDFSLYNGEVCDLVAQVKGGITGSTMSAAQAVRQLLRLSTHRAGRYLVVTNRRMGPSLAVLRELLSAHAKGTINLDEFKWELLELVQDSPTARHGIECSGSGWWEVLRRSEIVLDERGIDELREVLRERVRTARRALDPVNATWDAAGLLLGYLVSEVMAKAAAVDTPALFASDLKQALAVPPDILMSAVHRRGWSIYVTTAPRGADVARPELLNEIGQVLLTPVSDDSAPICVLKGMSGIGKTSLAAAWANDRRDAYAAIMWIDASETARVEASFATVGEWLRQEGFTTPGPDLRTGVLAALAQSARPWLVIFDNVVDMRLIREWIPTHGRGHILITTTDQTALKGSNIAEVAVTEMTLPEACSLLARRMLPARTPSDEEWATLARVAQVVQCWPLALELAAAYLTDCLDGLNGVDDYEQLIMRSLDDDLSTPYGYPSTLVKAIELAWQRMLSRAIVGSPPDDIACAALRCGAFFASQRIPLHLMLACVLVPLGELMDSKVRYPIFLYKSLDPSVGEIVRAIRRESLVSYSEPLTLDDDPEASVAPSSLSYAIGMNEIVQAIIREIVDREGNLTSVVSVAATHTQNWLAAFCDIDRIDLASSLIGHAISIAEHAVVREVDDPGVALLWGNTAKVLGHLHHWAGTVRYLRAELDYFDRSSMDAPVLRLQVRTGLAEALSRAADRPDEVVDDVITLLESCIADVNSAAALDEDITALHVRLGLSTVRNLIKGSGIKDSRLTALESALVAYCSMLPITGPDVLEEISILEDLLGQGRLTEARDRAERLLADPATASFYRPQYLRYLVEVCVRLPDWPAAADYVRQLMSMANDDALGAMDVALLVRNASIMSLLYICRRHRQATDVFRDNLAIATVFEQNGHRLQADDRAAIALLRALLAAIDGSFSECGTWLERVELEHLQITDHGAVLSSILGVLRYWYRESAINCEPQRNSSQVYPADDGAVTLVPTVSDGGVIGAIRQVPDARAVPCFTVAMAHVFCMSGRPIRSGLSVAAELAGTFRLLGFDADVIETVVQAWDAGGMLESGDTDAMHQIVGVRAEPHYLVWARSFDRIVDPTIVHTPAFFSLIDRGILEAGPIIFTVDNLEKLRRPSITLHPPIGLEYRFIRHIEWETAAAAWASAVTPAESYGDMLLTLLIALTPMRIDDTERSAEIMQHYPILNELLTPSSMSDGGRAPD